MFYHGGYVEALCFLTGEHQEYDKRAGVFGRVAPLHDYHWKKGDAYRACGAWQIGTRFSYVDLNDKGIQGGQIYDCTVGLNWYLNPEIRRSNAIMSPEHRDTPGVPEGWIEVGVGLRAAYDFDRSGLQSNATATPPAFRAQIAPKSCCCTLPWS